MSTRVTAPIVPFSTSRSGSRTATQSSEALGRNAAMGVGAAGLIFLIGTLLDLLVLWVLQRQEQPQWEFVALTNTLEALPRFVLAAGLLYSALVFGRSSSLALYRVLGGAVIALGFGAALLGALLVTDYFALARIAAVQPEALSLLRSSALKGVALSALHFFLLVPFGILSLRKPRN